nr:CAZy families GT20 protein [uncultured Bacteroides sp.]
MEHFYKEHGVWHKKIDKIVWDKEIMGVMEHISRRTPRSKIEVKDTALVWHYRNVDIWLADLRVTQLINALINPCSRHNLQIMKGTRLWK